MTMSLLTVSAGAVNTSSPQTPASIPEEVAEIMAGYFVRDFQSMPDTIWNSDTVIANAVTMYAPSGEVSAYSFELKTNGVDTGYVVISAYPDVESKILEFSDTAAPVYESLNLANNDKIVYTGALNYFKTIGSNDLLTVDGITISKADAPTPLENIRNDSYLPTLPAQTRAGGYPITDPFDWANAYYSGTFTAVEWKNPFESSCKFRTTGNYSSYGYVSHCSPTAITNLIEIVGYYRNYSGITSKSGTNGYSIFKSVADLGINKGYYQNSTSWAFGGSAISTMNAYTKEAFALFKANVSVSSSSVTYANVKNAINAYKPFSISLVNHALYGNHSVAAYAYTLLENGSGTSLGFVKIADGWYSSARYLPTSALYNATMHVITVGTLG